MMRVYIENNKCFGRDNNGRNIMLCAFQPLKVIQKNNSFSIVKPIGKGNYRSYLISNDELVVNG